VTALGVDVARWQNPAQLPLAAWVAAGLQVVVVQVTHGADPEQNAAGHLAAALAARVPHVGAYHFLTPGNARGQALAFLAALDAAGGRYQFAALDVEDPRDPAAPRLSLADVLFWIKTFTAGSQLPLLLYGNHSRLVPILEQAPELKGYPIWWSEYGPMAPHCQQPPYAAPHPPAGLRLAAWQWGGDNGEWLPYAGAIDRSTWYEIPGAPLMSADMRVLADVAAQLSAAADRLAGVLP